MKMYHYVGPPRILEDVKGSPPGEVIHKVDDVATWVRAQHAFSMQRGPIERITVTYVIDQQRLLRVADRCSEHVACAGGGPVFSAGELTFELGEGDVWEVVDVTNQSTGFCPEPKSWPLVKEALERVGLRHPGEFTRAYDFRRCEACEQLVLIKDAWFVCMNCEEDLPLDYNVQV